MRLLLAPMEGVVDWVMRDMLTEIGGIDQCVTEFLRISDQLLPEYIFHKYCPELKTQSKTRAGTPVFFQLLGGQTQPMAENAARAVELGALGIDLNFGCPAKTVNRHDGGASLLKTPERLFNIITAVRAAVPKHIPVTAKIRLGFDDPSACIANAQAADAAGAHWLTVHCRTKTDGYKPPAYWEWVPKIREAIAIPIIANGEVWSVEDYHRCRQISGSEDVMIGRGAIAHPYIFKQIKKSLLQEETQTLPPWNEVKPLLPAFFTMSTEFKSDFFAQARTKQWLRQLSLKYDEAIPHFEELKVITQPQDFERRLQLI